MRAVSGMFLVIRALADHRGSLVIIMSDGSSVTFEQWVRRSWCRSLSLKHPNSLSCVLPVHPSI